ncbi:hypothetical protein E4H12_04055 [Candidatus Thorarchaeota archaeon]|nr:MAG: hypothetical protein E4H12_04055 [Candidatus Thorarchaeota archaeon]
MKLSADAIKQYVEHGDEAIATMARQYVALAVAVSNVYYSAQWSADRSVNEQLLWQELRDAAGLLPGLSPTPTLLFEQMQALKTIP